MTLREGQIIAGALFSEPMRIETVRAVAPDVYCVGMAGMAGTSRSTARPPW